MKRFRPVWVRASALLGVAALLAGCSVLGGGRAVSRQVSSGVVVGGARAVSTAPGVPPGQPSMPPVGETSARSADGVVLNVKAGYQSGQSPPGAYVPVLVEVENPGADLEAEVRVGPGEFTDVRAQYARPALVPRGGKKAVRMYLPPMGQIVHVELVRGDEALVAADVMVQYAPVAFAAVLSDAPETLRHLEGLELNAGSSPLAVKMFGRGPGGPRQRLTVVRMRPDELPDAAEALSGLTAMVFNDVSTSAMSPAQWQAVEGWVRTGGTLVFGGGPNWRKTLAAAPESLLPLQVRETVQLKTAKALGEYAGVEVPAAGFVAADGAPRPGAEVVVREAGVPLLTTARLGQGRVYQFGIDLGLDPVATWRGNPALWQKLLQSASAGSNPMMFEGPGTVNRLGYTVRQFPSLEAPPVGTIFWLVLGYVLLVGPLNYLLLKRLDRRDWAWVIVPSIALLLGGSAFVFGFLAKGRHTLSNTVALMQLDGDGQGKLSAAVAVFAPSRERLTLQVPGRGMVGGLPGGGGPVSPLTDPYAVRIREGQQATQVELTDAFAWTLRGFTVNRPAPNAGRLRAELRAADGGLEGEIRNETPYRLFDVHVVAGQDVVKVGELAPGASAPVNLAFGGAPVMPGMPNFQPPAYRIYPPPQGPYGPRQWGQEERERQRLRNLLEIALMPNGGPAYNVRPTAIAFTSDPVADLGVETRPGLDHRLTLITQPAEVRLDGPAVTLPPGFVEGRLIEQDVKRGGGNGINHFFIEEGQLTFEIPLGLPGAWRYENLAVWFPTGAQHITQAQVEVYDWRKQAWTPAGWDKPGKVVVSDPGAAVSGKGEVRVRIRNDRGGIDFTTPTVELQARRLGG